EIKRQWLDPLLAGEIRSAFAMTEPAVASSDATNISSRIERDGDHYVINGRKWWTSGANDPRCKVFIFMGKTDPGANRHQQQSMIVVPADTPGITVMRALSVFGYDDAPHGHAEVDFKDVRVPASNILLGEGRGFEIAQGRLGPGRIHHCMRSIGVAERALELLCRRINSRVAFGKRISEQSVWRERIAEARCMIDQARLMTLKAAYMMDTVGNKVAKAEIAMIKVIAPNIACQITDWAIQAHGGGGVSGDFPVASMYAHQRTLRLADRPDRAHRDAIAPLRRAKRIAVPRGDRSPHPRGSRPLRLQRRPGPPPGRARRAASPAGARPVGLGGGERLDGAHPLATAQRELHVELGALSLARDLGGRQLAHHPRRNASHQRSRGHLAADLHEAHGGDDRLLADTGAVHHHRVHPDQRIAPGVGGM